VRCVQQNNQCGVTQSTRNAIIREALNYIQSSPHITTEEKTLLRGYINEGGRLRLLTSEDSENQYLALVGEQYLRLNDRYYNLAIVFHPNQVQVRLKEISR
jgi:hypothetical protein